ncbi:lipoprotein [Pantoea sp. 1.19]|uniref:lipoprotein n=1 Tax=Pantoea sp. 1.19 TaxID=1925589 RepID=UPI000948D862|nr:lipoprotein [Pantoea sp. 1.19]
MKKAFHGCCLLLAGLLLAGCNQLTSYTIGENDINQALQKRDKFEKQIGVDGLLNAHITLDQLQSQIGREEPGKITLTGHANVAITSLLGSQKADMQLKMKAQPVYDARQGAIFLRDLELVDSRVQPENMQAPLKTLTPYLNSSLKQWFDVHPAYVLSSERSKAELMAKKLAKGLEVKPGELVIPFTD